jgi:hypothetical protein
MGEGCDGRGHTQHFLNPLNLKDRSMPWPLGVSDHFPVGFRRGGRSAEASVGG